MGFASFVGRVFFASIFLLSAWQMFNEFGVDGGPESKELIPKLDLAKNSMTKRQLRKLKTALNLSKW